MKDGISQQLGVRITTDLDRYLGLPTMIGRNKKASFQYLKDRLNEYVDKWSSRLLSKGGKAVFIKSILQAVPTYAMSVFLLPATLCKELNGIISRFWWQKAHGKRGIAWTKWVNLCIPKLLGGLGFRDLVKFNIALLAKQGWRVLRRPNSLVTQVLKAKYFRCSDFLHSSLGSNPSMVWRGIWSAMGCLKLGVSWNIGNGRNVRIWEDPWLPNCEGGVPLTPRRTGIYYVYELIDHEARKWNEERIRMIFTDDDAAAILSIPLSLDEEEDSVSWKGECSGIFSVRSAYRRLVTGSFKVGECGQFNLTGNSANFYKRLWQLSIPDKIRINCWNFYQNFVPTLYNLYVRRSAQSPACPRCGAVTESGLHAIRDCDLPSAVWGSFGFDWSGRSVDETLQDWLEWVFSSLDKAQCEKVVIIMWACWYARNKALYERIQQTCFEVHTFVAAYIRGLGVLALDLVSRSPPREACWRPPEADWVKVNFDAAYNQEEKVSISGIVIRNEEGLPTAACHVRNFHIPTPLVAEGLAGRQAVQFAQDCLFRKVEVEGDSSIVIGKFKAMGSNGSEVGVFTRDVQRLVRNFEKCRFLHVRRGGNKLAHGLARRGLSRVEDQYWTEEVPAELRQCLDDDCRLLDPP